MRIASRLLIAAVSSCLLTGCSWIFMGKPPEHVAAPAYPIDCSTSRAPPVLDSICTGYFILNGAVLAGMKDCEAARYGESCASSSTRTGGMVLSVGLALLCGISAGTGFADAGRCESLKELNALCMTGDARACQRLRQGWTPAAGPALLPPVVPAADPMPLRSCMKDTECKGSRVCNHGECVEPTLPLPVAGPCSNLKGVTHARTRTSCAFRVGAAERYLAASTVLEIGSFAVETGTASVAEANGTHGEVACACLEPL